MAAPFKPKQHLTLSGADLAELQGDGSPQAIHIALKEFTPPFEPWSVIHDNACGSGSVAQQIMSANPSPPSGIQIHATDINERFVESTKAYARSKDWPVATAVMDARKLGFDNDFFTHSITAFMFHCMPGVEDAAREIHRTLKPGGTAIALIWTSMPHVAALQQAHWATRGRDGPMPALLPDEEPSAAEFLIDLFQTGGFRDVETRELRITIRFANLEHWAQLAWSFLGGLPGSDAWKKEDEEKWDEAISVIIAEMQKEGRGEKGEDGEIFMKYVAYAAVVRK